MPIRRRTGRPSSLKRASIFLSLITLAGVLAGCGLGMDNADRLARAQAAFSKSEFRSAIIDTRNILREEPNNREARLLLGRSALRVNDVATAEKELSRALELGAEPGPVIVELGQALLALQKHEQLLESVTPDLAGSGEERLTVLRLRGDALRGLDRPAEARTVYQEVLAAAANDLPALLGVAATFVAEGRYGEARQSVDRALAIDANHVQARLASGSLYLTTRNADAASGEFGKAAELAGGLGNRHDEITALTGLIQAQLAENELEAAKDTLAHLRQLAPDNLSTMYYTARVAYLEQDYALAQTELQRLLGIAPNSVPGQLLMGAVQLQRGSLGQAEMHLSSVIAAEPRNADARKLMAEIRIRQDRADEAGDILRPLLQTPGADPGVLNLAVRASLEAGKVDDAVGYLREAHENDPDNPQVQLDLAAAWLAAGELDRATALLESVPAGSAETDYRRELLQVMTPLRRGDSTTALADARAMAERWPNDARVRNLVGGIALSLNNPELARESFAAAQALAPDDISTYLNIGGIDLQQDNLESARAQYEAALERRPQALQPMLALAKLEARAENMDAAVRRLEKAREAEPSALPPRVLLARVYLDQRDYASAQKAAAELVALEAASAEAHNLLGLAQLGLGDTAAAVASFSKAEGLDSGQSLYRMNKARAELAMGEAEQAEQTLVGDGLDLDDVRTSVMVASLRAREGDAEGAMKIAKDLQARHPEDAVPYALEAELLAREKQYRSSSTLYDKALSLRADDPRLAIRAYRVRTAGGLDGRLAPLTDYLERQPLDASVRVLVAQEYQAEGQSDRAVAEYERVLAAEPDNFLALNNLAWEYFVRGDARAEATAKRALEQSPENGSVADTLGWIQVSAGNLEEGIPTLRKAVEYSKGNPEVQYHLAAGLAAAGQHDEARELLQQALSADTGLTSRSEAKQLLDSL